VGGIHAIFIGQGSYLGCIKGCYGFTMVGHVINIVGFACYQQREEMHRIDLN
jgi:hypothetical protein